MLSEIGRLRRKKFAGARPIQEFLDFRRISRPESFGALQSRIFFNLSRFSVNYLCIIGILSVYALLTNWLLLLVVAIAAAGLLLISRLEGRNFQMGPIDIPSNNLYIGLLVITVPLAFVASPLSTIFWIIGASFVSIGLHASFLDRPVQSHYEITEEV